MVKFGLRRKETQRPERRLMSSEMSWWDDSESLTTTTTLQQAKMMQNRKSSFPKNIISTMRHGSRQLVLIPAKYDNGETGTLEPEPDWEDVSFMTRESLVSLEEHRDWYDPVVVGKATRTNTYDSDLESRMAVFTSKEPASVASSRQKRQAITISPTHSATDDPESRIPSFFSQGANQLFKMVFPKSEKDDQGHGGTDQLYAMMNSSLQEELTAKSSGKENDAPSDLRHTEKHLDQVYSFVAGYCKKKSKSKDDAKGQPNEQPEKEKEGNKKWGTENRLDPLDWSGVISQDWSALQGLFYRRNESKSNSRQKTFDRLVLKKTGTVPGNTSETRDDINEDNRSKADKSWSPTVFFQTFPGLELFRLGTDATRETFDDGSIVSNPDHYSLSGQSTSCNSHIGCNKRQSHLSTGCQKINLTDQVLLDRGLDDIDVPTHKQQYSSRRDPKMRTSNPFQRVQSLQTVKSMSKTRVSLKKSRSVQSESFAKATYHSNKKEEADKAKMQSALPSYGKAIQRNHPSSFLNKRLNHGHKRSRRSRGIVRSSNDSVAESFVSEAFQLDPTNDIDFAFLAPFREWESDSEFMDDGTATQISSSQESASQYTTATVDTSHTRD